MRELQPSSPANHRRHLPFIYQYLKNCSHFFVRHDASRTQLQPTYNGLFKVLFIQLIALYLTLKAKRQLSVFIELNQHFSAVYLKMRLRSNKLFNNQTRQSTKSMTLIKQPDPVKEFIYLAGSVSEVTNKGVPCCHQCN